MPRTPTLPPAWTTPARAAEHCPLCGRPLPDGPSADEHHWVPRSLGGVETSRLHRICHQKIHATFAERELAARYHTPEHLLGHPVIARFVAWVRQRPPGFLDRSCSTRALRGRRR